MKLATLEAVQDREADAFDKTLYANAELMAVTVKFSASVQRLETSRAIQSFAGMRSAYLDIETLLKQAGPLVEGIQHAIEVETERRKS